MIPIQSDPIWSDLTRSDLTWPDVIRSNPIWPDPIWSDLIWPNQIQPNLFRQDLAWSDSTWSDMTQHNPTGPHLTGLDPNWPDPTSPNCWGLIEGLMKLQLVFKKSNSHKWCMIFRGNTFFFVNLELSRELLLCRLLTTVLTKRNAFILMLQSSIWRIKGLERTISEEKNGNRDLFQFSV
jgi:hypothetical protein